MDLLSKTYYCSAHNSVDIAFFRTFVSLSWIYFPSHSHFFFTLFCGLCFFSEHFLGLCHYWEIFGLCPFYFLKFISKAYYYYYYSAHDSVDFAFFWTFSGTLSLLGDDFGLCSFFTDLFFQDFVIFSSYNSKDSVFFLEHFYTSSLLGGIFGLCRFVKV